MGLGWKELLIILAIVLLVFGTKRLKNVGTDLGEAVKGFKKGLNGEEAEPNVIPFIDPYLIFSYNGFTEELTRIIEFIAHPQHELGHGCFLGVKP